jgi:hypothetical protein
MLSLFSSGGPSATEMHLQSMMFEHFISKFVQLHTFVEACYEAGCISIVGEAYYKVCCTSYCCDNLLQCKSNRMKIEDLSFHVVV